MSTSSDLEIIASILRKPAVSLEDVTWWAAHFSPQSFALLAKVIAGAGFVWKIFSCWNLNT